MRFCTALAIGLMGLAALGVLWGQKPFREWPAIEKTISAVFDKLGPGFKAVFGETIFDFSLRCRMQHALQLLRDERTQVARVAEAVGYRHQTSFATAFRRHFGLRPKDVRRGLRA